VVCQVVDRPADLVGRVPARTIMARASATTPTSAPAREGRGEESDAAGQDTSAQSSASAKGITLSRRWIVILVLVWLVVNGAGVTYYQCRSRPAAAAANGEVELGSYRFLAAGEEHHRLRSASFELHASLATATEKVARERLAARKFRVQQDIEELLRRAHPADFDDPGLRELKRQLLEQVNESIGVQALSEVIITNLALTWGDSKPSSPVAGTSPPRGEDKAGTKGEGKATAKGEDAAPRAEPHQPSAAHQPLAPSDGLATHH